MNDCGRTKARAELAYWANRKAHEGRLRNDHYQYFFTTHFGLLALDYQGERVLDVGCGPRGSLQWAGMALERVGLDPLAGDYLRLGAAEQQMRYVAAVSEQMPFDTAHFDIVSSFNSLDHVTDLLATIREIARVTRPGGRFLLLSDVNHHPTVCEPIAFSWEITAKFRPWFEILHERRYVRNGTGMYQSVRSGIEFDDRSPASTPGVISAKFLRNAREARP
jgi:ubiquinone/menaquinone biosynthesis C-methylase UbiE